MSVVDSSISTYILERRRRRVEEPLLDLDVLPILTPVRAFVPDFRNHQYVKALLAEGLAYRRSLAGDGLIVDTSDCKIVCPS